MVAGGSPLPAAAANCAGTSVGFTPLSDLGNGEYKGAGGGLYPGGRDAPPAAHLAAASARAAAMAPLDTAGNPSAGGRIVLLSIGMSNATQEYSAFVQLARADPQMSPRVLLVDGAEGGQTASRIRDPNYAYWSRVEARLAQAGASAAQVQAVWLKEANASPGQQFPAGSFPAYARALQADLEAVVHILHDRFPNLRLVYLSNRTYGGYAATQLNPEPYAYESGFSVKWLIEKQIDGDAALNFDPARGPARAPLLLWGPDLWADGLQSRGDGLAWRCEDFADDGTHPSTSGRHKVASLLLAFFKSGATARGWFMADPGATPAPVPTFNPGPMPTRDTRLTPTPGTPGTPGPRPTGGTPTAAPLRSYRVRETPTGDAMWVAVASAQAQQMLERLAPERPTWLCGRVRAAAGSEWGFMFDPATIRLAADPPMQAARTAIRAIAANPAAAPLACIRVDGVLARAEGEPPAVPTATPGGGTATAGPTATAEEPMPTPPPTVAPTWVPTATPGETTWRVCLPWLANGYAGPE